MDIVALHITQTLAPAPTLARVEGRVQESFLIDLPTDQRYPCVIFSRIPGGSSDPYNPIETQRVQIEAISDVSRDEAWDLAMAADALLDKTTQVVEGSYLMFYQVTPPIKATDTSGRPVYRVILIYEITVFV